MSDTCRPEPLNCSPLLARYIAGPNEPVNRRSDYTIVSYKRLVVRKFHEQNTLEDFINKILGDRRFSRIKSSKHFTHTYIENGA